MGKVSCIYKISNSINEKIYIGSTLYFNQRKSQHFASLKRGTHRNKKLQNFVNKYGISTLRIEILETVTNTDYLIVREQHYIDTLKPWFNVAPIAGNCKGVKHTEESKNKWRGLKNRLGKKSTVEAKLNYSIGQKKRFENPSERERLKNHLHLFKPLHGEQNGSCKLSDIEVQEIRSKYIPREYSTRKLAKEYNVSNATISQIVNFESRKIAA